MMGAMMDGATRDAVCAADDSAQMAARLELALTIAARKSQRRRAEDTFRVPRTMWELLCWTYRCQIIRAQAWAVSRWTDVLFALDGAGDVACSWHIDAVAVHAAVSMLPVHQRDAVWSASKVGVPPPRPDGRERPRFRPEERQGRGDVRPVKRRYWHGCAPITLKPLEIKRLCEAPTREEREVTIMRDGQRHRYRYDPRKISYRQKGQATLRDAATGRLRAVASVEAEVEVEFCPLRWVVDMADLAGRHEQYRHFHDGVAAVRRALAGRVLFHTELGGLGVEAPAAAPAMLWRGPTRAEREIMDAAWVLTGAQEAG